jgi:DNA-binding PucR family transcriptional regulator
MPRALVFVYTLRNKRGIGHVGGDVDANHIDAMTIARVCDWIVCELIRTFHNLSLEEAQDIVDSLAQRNLPEVWNVAGKKRILRDGLTFKDQVLLLCYAEQESTVFAEDLLAWVEYANASRFKSEVLRSLHGERLIEYDRENDQVIISPKGVKEVETRILKQD